MENVIIIIFLCLIIIGKWCAIFILPNKYLKGEVDEAALHFSLILGITFLVIGLIFGINDFKKGNLYSSLILFVYAITGASGVIAFTKVIIKKRRIK